MTGITARIATSLSRISAITMIALATVTACANDASPASAPVDASTTPIACGTASCVPADVCAIQETDGPGGSNDPIDTDSCVVPAAGCALADCELGHCPDCITQMCPVGGISAFSLSTRTLQCFTF